MASSVSASAAVSVSSASSRGAASGCRGYCSRRPRRGRGRRWLCGGCGLRGGGDDTGRGGGDCGGGTGEADLFEQMAARDIAGRTAPVVVVGHDVLPSVFLSCSMVHPALVCRKHTLVSRPSALAREPACKPRPSPAGLTRGSIRLRKSPWRSGWIAGSSPAMTAEKQSAQARPAQRIRRVSYAKSHVDTHHVQEPNMPATAVAQERPSHKTNTRKRHAVICQDCRGTSDRARGFRRVHRSVIGFISRRGGHRRLLPGVGRPPMPPASQAR